MSDITGDSISIQAAEKIENAIEHVGYTSSQQQVGKAIQVTETGAKLADSTGKIKGVEVVDLDPKSKVARLGIEKGDIIVGVNRQSVETVADLNKILSESKGAQAIKIVRGNMNLYIILR